MTSQNAPHPVIDYKAIFEAAPGLYLILLPDSKFTIAAVSDSYAAATMTKRDEIIGRGLFEVFPDNPDDKFADGENNLRASLNHVLKNKTAHTMAVQKYDIRRPDGTFEVRWWSPVNKPVLDQTEAIKYIIHRVEDVTDYIQASESWLKKDKHIEGLERRVGEMEMEIYARAQKIQRMNSDLENIIQLLKESKDKYHTLFNSIDQGYCIIEMIFDERNKPVDYRFLEINAAFEKQTGMNNAVGKRMREFAPDHEEHWFETYGKIALTGEAIRFVNRAEQLGRWYDVYAFRFGEPENKQVAILFNDISARKNTEEQLKEFQHFFNNSNDLCGIANTNGFFETINNKFEKILGYSEKEFLEHPFFHFIHPDDIPATEHEVEKLKQGVTTINFTNRYRKNDGSYVWLEWHSTPDTATGKLYAIARDITQRKNAEEQLQAVNKELEAFSYSVSHDLRAPLRAVNGFSDMLLQQYNASLDDNAKRLLRIIKTNAISMGQLIDDLLQFSRIGRKEVTPSQTNMQSLVQSVISELTQNEPEKAACITTHKLPNVFCDSQLMKQVWLNLISNALKYSSKKENPQIEIGAEIKNDKIIFHVKDNGAGFDMQYAGKLFGVFQRLHSQKEFEGNGVGLALVQRIITKHGGNVWAQAEIDKGATFFFSLKAREDRE